jgi:hypothetical protein
MEQKEASTRAMTDLDARMGYMKTRMNDFEEKLEARVATVRIYSLYLCYTMLVNGLALRLTL